MTAAPATVKDVFTVDLPRPRAVEELRLSEEFLSIYRLVWASLRAEVDKTRERGAGNAG